MSEPAAKRPMDFDDFERRLRAPEPAPQVAGHDPLAELARLVDGNRDPYADMFGRPPVAPQRANLPGLKAVQHDFGPEPAPVAAAPEQQAPAPAAEVPGADEWQLRRDEWPPAFPQTRTPAPAIDPPPVSQGAYDQPEADYAEAPAPKKSRKAFYLMAASLAAVAAGVGATVLTRGSSHTSQDAPIIKAAQGPMKVQPEQSAATSEPTRAASVLDRSADKLGPTKVVNREEQPIDIGAAKVIRQAPPAAAAPAQTANIFPEPRKVRTIPVRPDGTLATDLEAKSSTVAALPAPTPAPAARPTTTASITPQQMPKATPSAPSPTTTASAPAPKTTARVAPPDAARPQQVAARPLSLSGASDPSPVASTPKPMASGGGFSVQLAAAGSDAEAREKAGKFASQFSGAFNGRRPAVVHGEANGKQVYRVRITGLSKDDAASMCGKIKQGGGACFVAAN